MSTVTAEDLDLDMSVLGALDFDYAPPCCLEKCESEATHMLTMKCCAAVYLVCETCLFMVIETINEKRAAGRTGKCKTCKNKTYEFPYIVTPIKS